ncbi:unnamed protein product, partial [Prorocentrum cordatum]
ARRRGRGGRRARLGARSLARVAAGVWRRQGEVARDIVPRNSDLLLLGHTKRMHLFEQRWVDMVETARSQFNGIVGLVYFGRDGNVVRVTTIAEIVACDNLGAVGRMVVVRGVSRGSLLGLSKEVPMSDSFGYAVVEELAELCADDVAPPAGGAVGGAADGGGGAAAAAAASLTALMKELDLSEPRNASSEVKAKAEVSKGDDQTGESSDAEEPRQRAPQLWTHERVSPAEEFAALSGEDSWAQRRAAVEDCLSGVPICGAAAALDGAESATIAAAEAAVIDLYTALAAASLNLRLQLFADDGAGVGERLGLPAAAKLLPHRHELRANLLEFNAQPEPVAHVPVVQPTPNARHWPRQSKMLLAKFGSPSSFRRLRKRLARHSRSAFDGAEVARGEVDPGMQALQASDPGKWKDEKREEMRAAAEAERQRQLQAVAGPMDVESPGFADMLTAELQACAGARLQLAGLPKSFRTAQETLSESEVSRAGAVSMRPDGATLASCNIASWSKIAQDFASEVRARGDAPPLRESQGRAPPAAKRELAAAGWAAELCAQTLAVDWVSRVVNFSGSPPLAGLPLWRIDTGSKFSDIEIVEKLDQSASEICSPFKTGRSTLRPALAAVWSASYEERLTPGDAMSDVREAALERCAVAASVDVHRNTSRYGMRPLRGLRGKMSKVVTGAYVDDIFQSTHGEDNALPARRLHAAVRFGHEVEKLGLLISDKSALAWPSKAMGARLVSNLQAPQQWALTPAGPSRPAFSPPLRCLGADLDLWRPAQIAADPRVYPGPRVMLRAVVDLSPTRAAVEHRAARKPPLDAAALRRLRAAARVQRQVLVRLREAVSACEAALDARGVPAERGGSGCSATAAALDHAVAAPQMEALETRIRHLEERHQAEVLQLRGKIDDALNFGRQQQARAQSLEEYIRGRAGGSAALAAGPGSAGSAAAAAVPAPPVWAAEPAQDPIDEGWRVGARIAVRRVVEARFGLPAAAKRKAVSSNPLKVQQLARNANFEPPPTSAPAAGGSAKGLLGRTASPRLRVLSRGVWVMRRGLAATGCSAALGRPEGHHWAAVAAQEPRETE